MTGFMLLGGGLFFVATSIVGVRLLVLAHRNRSLPELLLGAAFLVGGTIGGSFGQYLQVSVAANAHPPAVLGAMTLAFTIISVAGLGLYNAFTWRVFRKNEWWATALLIAMVCFGIAMIGWYQLSGVFETGVQPPMARAIMTAANAIGPVWAMLEGFRYALLMSRRVDLGLADPLVANRFLLWAIGGLCATLIVLGGLLLIFLPETHPLVLVNQGLVGVLGTIASVAYGLAFFPPPRFAEWVRGARQAT